MDHQTATTTPSTGIRAAISRRRGLTAALAVFLILAAGTFLTWFYWPEPTFTVPTRAWYTVDDGATRFEDDAERIPPFDHAGKPAVRLHLYSCDGGKTTFVGYLQKLPEETLQQYRDKGIDPATVDDDELASDGGWMAKRPGGEWVNSKTDADGYRQIVIVHCPGGGTHEPIEVFPNNPRK